MPRTVNPTDIAKPQSNYAHAVVHKGSGERVVISGQVGVEPDGRIAQGFEAQAECCWANILGCLRATGFEVKHLVKVTTFVTEPGRTAAARAIRDRIMAGHTCASTYLQVSGLARPELVIEIEAEAVKD
jgi:enamine deaminase RidA (YjgF/YER057c/UK114 family)